MLILVGAQIEILKTEPVGVLESRHHVSMHVLIEIAHCQRQVVGQISPVGAILPAVQLGELRGRPDLSDHAVSHHVEQPAAIRVVRVVA